MTSQNLGGDDIKTLPVDKEGNSSPSDLEIVHNIFSPKNKEVILSAVSHFKLSFVASMLFLLFSLPFVIQISEQYCRNQICGRLLLGVLFIIIFFILQKLWLNK